MCQDSMLSGGGRSLGAKISGGRVVHGEYFLVSTKLRHILLSDSANCTVLRAVVLTQYQRVTDGPTDRQTDSRNCRIASTAFAKRRAVTTPHLTPLTLLATLASSLTNILLFLTHFAILQCKLHRAVVLTQYRRVTDRRTDGIAVVSTALGMRALRRAVKRSN